VQAIKQLGALIPSTREEVKNYCDEYLTFSPEDAEALGFNLDTAIKVIKLASYIFSFGILPFVAMLTTYFIGDLPSHNKAHLEALAESSRLAALRSSSFNNDGTFGKYLNNDEKLKGLFTEDSFPLLTFKFSKEDFKGEANALESIRKGSSSEAKIFLEVLEGKRGDSQKMKAFMVQNKKTKNKFLFVKRAEDRSSRVLGKTIPHEIGIFSLDNVNPDDHDFINRISLFLTKFEKLITSAAYNITEVSFERI
jgi:hypothetical protein